MPLERSRRVLSRKINVVRTGTIWRMIRRRCWVTGIHFSVSGTISRGKWRGRRTRESRVEERRTEEEEEIWNAVWEERKKDHHLVVRHFFSLFSRLSKFTLFSSSSQINHHLASRPDRTKKKKKNHSKGYISITPFLTPSPKLKRKKKRPSQPLPPSFPH